MKLSLTFAKSEHIDELSVILETEIWYTLYGKTHQLPTNQCIYQDSEGYFIRQTHEHSYHDISVELKPNGLWFIIPGNFLVVE